MDITALLNELIQILSSTDVEAELDKAASVAEQILSLIGLKNTARDIQSWQAFRAAEAGSVTAAQWLYHNAQPDSGMPHEDIVDGQADWAKLVARGWTVTGTGLTGVVSPPASK